jgi:8-oxo-dGTP pyrophosphatase MutT (NUDIX family)
MNDTTYNYVCSGYLVHDNKVLLVLHNTFKKWTPPGGHTEPSETLVETAEREFLEETGLKVEAISAAPVIHPKDSNATPLALPFYMDVMTEGFSKPTVGLYYFVRSLTPLQDLVIQDEELDDARWFSAEELAQIPTFDQVRSLALWALKHYPQQSA